MKIINSVGIKNSQLLGLILALTSLSMFSFIRSNDEARVEMVVIETKFGEMTVMLYDETPLHKENFLKLVNESFYDSLLFHRVIRNFMVQGGDPNSRGAVKGARLGTGGPGYTIPAEFNNKFIHKKGALSAARQPDMVNPDKNSSGSQFYIVQGRITDRTQLESFSRKMSPSNPFKEAGYSEEQVALYESIGGTPHLDGEYTVFGEVVSGLDIIDSIAAVPVDRNDRPLEDVIMTMKVEKVKWP
jgi:cyclophilin family peptidyl-prolyl cis-trans isomerase